MLCYKVICKVAYPSYQYISVRVRDFTITQVYVSPSARLAEVVECLKVSDSKCQRGMTVIMGDLNTRHES